MGTWSQFPDILQKKLIKIIISCRELSLIWIWSHLCYKYQILTPTLHISKVYLFCWVSLRALRWIHSSNYYWTFPFWFGGLFLRLTAAQVIYFQKATSFIEKCPFHFRTDLPRGGSDICRKQSQTMYSLLPRSRPHPPSLPCPCQVKIITHQHMTPLLHLSGRGTWADESFRSLASEQFDRARSDFVLPVWSTAPWFPVIIKSPL